MGRPLGSTMDAASWKAPYILRVHKDAEWAIAARILVGLGLDPSLLSWVLPAAAYVMVVRVWKHFAARRFLVKNGYASPKAASGWDPEGGIVDG